MVINWSFINNSGVGVCSGESIFTIPPIPIEKLFWTLVESRLLHLFDVPFVGVNSCDFTMIIVLTTPQLVIYYNKWTQSHTPSWPQVAAPSSAQTFRRSWPSKTLLQIPSFTKERREESTGETATPPGLHPDSLYIWGRIPDYITLHTEG